ncbi:MAG: hypothetical protein C5S49_01665 [Candidatus Methanogaster sp.]|nr:MAG: hypothetical protein C5S49_01665 [ANME-2 cluster archaeon]
MIIIALLYFHRGASGGSGQSGSRMLQPRSREAGDQVVRIASVRNKTAETAEGRGGSVKKLLRYSRVLCG